MGASTQIGTSLEDLSSNQRIIEEGTLNGAAKAAQALIGSLSKFETIGDAASEYTLKCKKADFIASKKIKTDGFIALLIGGTMLIGGNHLITNFYDSSPKLLKTPEVYELEAKKEQRDNLVKKLFLTQTGLIYLQELSKDEQIIQIDTKLNQIYNLGAQLSSNYETQIGETNKNIKYLEQQAQPYYNQVSEISNSKNSTITYNTLSSIIFGLSIFGVGYLNANSQRKKTKNELFEKYEQDLEAIKIAYATKSTSQN